MSGVTYNPANQLLIMNYPGAAETRAYNVLGQLTQIFTPNVENLTYTYPTGTNNGKISSMYNAVSAETNRTLQFHGAELGGSTWRLSPVCRRRRPGS